MELVKEFVFKADDGSVLNDLLGKTETDTIQRIPLEDPVWIADQFLNPRETLLDMEELLKLICATGFKIKQVLGMKENISTYFNSLSLYERFQKLNNDRRLIALDLLTKPERYFIVLRKVLHKKSNG